MKVKITGCRGALLWYGGFIGAIVDVSENKIHAGSRTAYMVSMDKCSEDMKDVFTMLEERGALFPGVWWIYDEDCKVVEEETTVERKDIKVGDVVCFIGDRYVEGAPIITVTAVNKSYLDDTPTIDGVYFNKVNGYYVSISGTSVDTVVRK